MVSINKYFFTLFWVIMLKEKVEHMEVKSLKESSLKKYKDSCHLIIILTFFGALFAWGSRHDIGSFNAILSVIIDLVIMILAIIVFKTKSKIFSMIIILIMLVLVGMSFLFIIKGEGILLGGFGIIVMIVSFNLYTHLTNIHNDYDKYNVSFNLKDNEDWEKIKLTLKEQYTSDGYEETRNNEKVFSLKKDSNQYLQLIRNNLKCSLSVSGTKEPIINLD